MDVREKLVELLQNAKAAMKSENLSCDIARNMFVVDFMMANGVTVQEWISVEDRLPEDVHNRFTHSTDDCRNRRAELRGERMSEKIKIKKWDSFYERGAKSCTPLQMF